MYCSYVLAKIFKKELLVHLVCLCLKTLKGQTVDHAV